MRLGIAAIVLGIYSLQIFGILDSWGLRAQQLAAYWSWIPAALTLWLLVEGVLAWRSRRQQNRLLADNSSLEAKRKSAESEWLKHRAEQEKESIAAKERAQDLAKELTAAKEKQLQLTLDLEQVEKAAREARKETADDSAFSLLSLLQERGRLVDFLQEDVSSLADEQVGAASRVVHLGCQKVLKEFFDIHPVAELAEGETVHLEPDFDLHRYRVLGKTPEAGALSGTIVHPGWQAKSSRLPKTTGPNKGIIAPAEIEVSGGRA